MKHDLEIARMLANETVVLSREHPESLQCALKRAMSAGRVARILPGVYTDAAAERDFRTRTAAVARWDPSAVIRGRAAAKLTYWPEITCGPIEVASPVRHNSQPGFAFTRSLIPPELVQVRAGVRVTSPSLTAVELATLDFTDPIDIALRRRAVTLESLKSALSTTPHRRHNTQRGRVLLESRTEPWSAAERLAHRLYRRAGIGGWISNYEVNVPHWGTCFLDLGFRRQRVAVEVDGLIHQTDRELFETDRSRQNALVLDGWLLLRFTWRMLTEDPDYLIETTRRALKQRDRFAPLSGLTEPFSPLFEPLSGANWSRCSAPANTELRPSGGCD